MKFCATMNLNCTNSNALILAHNLHTSMILVVENRMYFRPTQSLSFVWSPLIVKNTKEIRHAKTYCELNCYRWMYDNLDLWGSSNERKDASIITIRNGLANLPLVGIPEISLAATLVELTS